MRRIYPILFLLMLGMQAQAAGDYLCVGDTNIKLGPFVDETDGDTVLTSLTISQADVRKSLANGNFAQKADASACTHDEIGMYDCPLSAASDTDTPGQFLLAVNEATASPVWWRGAIYSQAWCDVIEGTTDLLNSNDVGQTLEDTVASVTDQTNIVLTNGHPGNDAYRFAAATIFDVTNSNTPCEVDVLDYVGSSETLILRGNYNGGADACAFTIASSDIVRIRSATSGSAMVTAQNDLDDLTASDGSGVLISDDALTDAKIPDTSELGILLNSLVIATGTCDSGSTSTCVDTERTEADTDELKGRAVVFTSGNLDKQSACIYDFAPGTDTFSFRPVVTQSVTTHTYAIITAPGCLGVVDP